MEITDSVHAMKVPGDHVSEAAKEVVVGVVGGVTQVMIGRFGSHIDTELYCHRSEVGLSTMYNY